MTSLASTLPIKAHIACFDTQYRYLFFDDAHHSIIKQIWGSSVELGINVLDYRPDNQDKFLIKDLLDHAMTGQFF